MSGRLEPYERTWRAADAADQLRIPTRDDHKYSRGVVALRTGGPAFPGAAVLSVEGAWRAGAGLVRWAGDADTGRLVLQRRPETVVRGSRVDALVAGSGVPAAADRDERTTRRIQEFLARGIPAVVDAGALDLAAHARGPVVVTPHDRELLEVRIPLGLGPSDVGEDPLLPRLRHSFDERLLAVRETAIALGGVVLLKGATTIVATPGGWWTAVDAGTPWLATAGTGDVLAGAMGAVIAQAAAGSEDLDVERLGPLAATAAWVHGTAGRLAAGDGPGHPITALDVAEHLPLAFRAAFADDAG
ncbi:ADP-dependent NAD(P)H-hydrate dehydratase [Microbacterium sp. gxy059]|uniref:ADP-dependent NAD(P)H-hydrate dehydratase n=1 Tax=Microbacterium sp. gxy059 TaxID=2957199 RepID=UPI003D972179